uniref:Uncharacterized protein n=1 Tax=Romanomermis culicivorax TaxID=13658 RepID=A0A915KJF9_ROMCU
MTPLCINEATHDKRLLCYFIHLKNNFDRRKQMAKGPVYFLSKVNVKTIFLGQKPCGYFLLLQPAASLGLSVRSTSTS